MQIPVFHDDQHGTAIISGAALMNGAELAGKKLDDVQDRRVGRRRRRRSRAPSFYVELGVRRENVTHGRLAWASSTRAHRGHEPYKARFARQDDGRRTLADAMRGADVFLGLSIGGHRAPPRC